MKQKLLLLSLFRFPKTVLPAEADWKVLMETCGRLVLIIVKFGGITGGQRGVGASCSPPLPGVALKHQKVSCCQLQGGDGQGFLL